MNWEVGIGDVREVLKATSFARAGDLALTGAASTSTSIRPFLLLADPTSLEPIADTGRVYGDPGVGWAWSLLVQPAGFVMAGRFLGTLLPDQDDATLLMTDRWGHTTCDAPLQATSFDPGIAVESVMPTAESFLRQTVRNVWTWPLASSARSRCPAAIP